MRLRYLLVIAWLLIGPPTWAFTSAIQAVVSGGAVESCSTTLDTTGSVSETNTVSNDTGYYYSGSTYTPTGTGTKNICKITLILTKTAGDVSTKTYNLQIWTDNGSFDKNTLVATSSGVTGSNSWSSTSVDFNYSSPAGLTAGTQYLLALTANGIDGSNYISVGLATSAPNYKLNWPDPPTSHGYGSGLILKLTSYVQ